MSGLGKKGTAMCSTRFRQMFDQVSKAALIDALWCACQIGTNDTEPEYTTQAARNMVIALAQRKDRCPRDILAAAAQPIDSD